MRIVDGSVIRSSGKRGTDWRLHATYDPADGRFSQLEISDTHGGESLSRHRFEKGDLVLGDRGYARTPGLLHVREMGADFIMRIGWSTIRLLTASGSRLDWNAVYDGMQPGDVAEHEVLVDHSGRKRAMLGASTFRARLIVRRKDEASSKRARKAIWFAHRRKQRVGEHPNPLTVMSADFLLLLTSVPSQEMSADTVVASYRLRWQIELAFKRLKSGLGIGALPARDSQLARSWLAAHLIAGLLIDEAAADSLAFLPVVRPRQNAHLSLWRVKRFLRNILLVAIFGEIRLSRVGLKLMSASRNLFEPPRRRISQFGLLGAPPLQE
jgi:hypothetical protein